MKKKNIPVNQFKLGKDEKKNILECLNGNWISSEGKFVNEFEKKFSKIFNQNYGVALSSGTAAIEVAIDCIGIKQGDEIILPSFTIISCVLEIIRRKAIPVFVDCDRYTWNMNVDQIEKKITSKTKAIMVVHIYGLPTEMDKIISLTKKYKLKLIEDSAEAHGQSYHNKKCGSFGDISTFSFYANKHITCGEGGMLLTNNKKYYENAKGYRNLFFTSKRFVHKKIGQNFRITNLQAAIGCAQLKHLNKVIKRKIEIGKKYNYLLFNEKNIQLPIVKTSYAKNHFWVYGIVLKNKLDGKKNLIIKELTKRGIGTRPFFFPLHLQPIIRKKYHKKDLSFPHCENIYKNGFYLPSGTSIKNHEIEYITKNLKEIISKLLN
jgi:perosamine synthetase